MYKLLNKKVCIAFVVFFILCICTYALSSALICVYPEPYEVMNEEENSNSLSNTGFPRAYFMPDRSEVTAFKNREMILECMLEICVFSAVLFTSLVYYARHTDRHTKPGLVLLI